MMAYLTLAEARDYCAKRGLADRVYDDKTWQALLLRASEMIDMACVFAGHKLTSDQIRAWPRNDIYDEAGAPILAIPHQVISLNVELALLLGNDEKEALRAIGLAEGITQERIGDIQVRYGADTHSLPPLLRRLSPLLAHNKPIPIKRA